MNWDILKNSKEYLNQSLNQKHLQIILQNKHVLSVILSEVLLHFETKFDLSITLK